MPRLRNRAFKLDARTESALLMALRIGPTTWDDFTDEDLRVGWDVYGDRVMAAGGLVGTRPWGWWRFVGREEPQLDDLPSANWHAPETIRLAELGELSREELAELEENANVARSRIGTAAERFSGGGRQYGVPVDQQDIDLWEAVQAALARKGGDEPA